VVDGVAEGEETDCCAEELGEDEEDAEFGFEDVFVYAG